MSATASPTVTRPPAFLTAFKTGWLNGPGSEPELVLVLALVVMVRDYPSPRLQDPSRGCGLQGAADPTGARHGITTWVPEAPWFSIRDASRVLAGGRPPI